MRKNDFFCGLLTGLLSLSLMLTGCSSSSSGVNGAAANEGAGNAVQTSENTARTDEELNVALLSIPITMDPQKVSDNASFQYLSPVLATLFRLGENNELEPELAESYEVSEDGLTYTFRLKEGLRYSNGSAIKARDFVYAFRRIADPQEASSSIFILSDICEVKNVEKVSKGELHVEELGVSAPDELTFVVELEQPCPYFLYCLTMVPTSPCKESFVRLCKGHYADSPETMLASGPFMVDKYEPMGIQVHYVKNPYYVDADKVKLPGVNFRQVANVQQAEMVYQTGETDIIPVSREYLGLSKDDPNLHSIYGGLITYIVGNFQNSEAWANKNIRQAFSKAIDRDSIAENFYYSGATGLTRVVPAQFATEPDGSDFGGDVHMFDDDAGYDPQKAAELFKKGLQELSLDKLTLSIIASSSNSDLMEIIKSQTEENLPGFQLDVKLMPIAQLMDSANKGKFDLMITGWVPDYPDPNSYLGLMKSDSEMNRGHFLNKDVDSALQNASVENDPQKRMQYLHDAEKAVMNDLGMVPLVSLGGSWLISERAKNVNIRFDGNVILVGFAEKR